MNLYCLGFIIIIMIISKSAADYEYQSCQADKECGSYAYKVVKPLLSYVKQLKAEQENNNNVQIMLDKDNKIKLLQEKLDKQNEIEVIIKDLRYEIYSSRKIIEQLPDNLQSIKDEIKEFKKLKCTESNNEMSASKTQEIEDQLKTHKAIIKELNQKLSNIQNEEKEYRNKQESLIPHENKSYCDDHNSNRDWIIIQQRKFGNEDFRRNWYTYRNGFGRYPGDFFLGLGMIHSLTSTQPHKLCIHMQDFDGVIKYASYDQFAISDEYDNYRLILLSDATGNATYDNLQIHKGQPFSTFDRDNDKLNDYNCALDHAGGWWYAGCGHSNLNGRYFPGKICRNDSIYWDENVSLKIVKMLISPNKKN